MRRYPEGVETGACARKHATGGAVVVVVVGAAVVVVVVGAAVVVVVVGAAVVVVVVGAAVVVVVVGAAVVVVVVGAAVVVVVVGAAVVVVVVGAAVVVVVVGAAVVVVDTNVTLRVNVDIEPAYENEIVDTGSNIKLDNPYEIGSEPGSGLNVRLLLSLSIGTIDGAPESPAATFDAIDTLSNDEIPVGISRFQLI